MKSGQGKPQHEFHVTIGVELPPETAKRIAQAIQRSVLAELAGVDLKGSLAVDFLGGEQRALSGGNGGTQGIAIRAERM